MRALRGVRQVISGCAFALAVVAMVAIAGMMLTICYDVLARFALTAPTDWAYPLNSVGVLAGTTLAIPYLYIKRQHIAMDLVHRAMPHRLRQCCDLCTTVAAGLLGVVLAATALRSMIVAIDGGLTGSGTFNIPLWIPDGILVVTGMFLTLVAVLFPPSARDNQLATVPGDAAANEPEGGLT